MAATEALPSFDPMPGVWPRYHVGKDSMFIARQFGRISRLGAEITGIVGAPPEIQCLTQPPLCQALPCQAFLMTPVSH